MITFLTLFLGLATGPQPVALAVLPPAMRIELVLDGDPVAELTGPPWLATLDLGDELQPRRLEAIGYDRDGREVARAGQTINLKARRADAELAVERDAAGQPVALLLAWQSVEHPTPERVDVRLDGELLPVKDPRRIALPRLAPGTHMASAELVFPDAATARADLVVGDAPAASVTAQDTALALIVERRGALADVAGTTGLVRAGERPAEVVAVERGAADLVVVPDRGAGPEIGALRPEIERMADYDRRHIGAGLDGGDRLFLVSSLPERARAGGRGLLFRAAPGRPPEHGGLAWQLSHVAFPTDHRPQRLSDAVAVAGMMAASGRRPRAVLLVLGPDPEDAGSYPPAEVRRYLARLRVPLAVWSVAPDPSVLPPLERPAAAERRPALEARRAELRSAWGEIEEIGSAEALYDAARRLRDQLRDQRIVWVAGEHLPTELTLAPEAPGARLALSLSAGGPTEAPPETPPVAAMRIARTEVEPPEAQPEGTGGRPALPGIRESPAATEAPADPEPAAAAAPASAAASPAATAPPPAAQRAPPPEPRAEPILERFAETLEVSLIDLEVTVTDRAGRRLHGLGPESFSVEIGGRPAEVVHFAELGAPEEGDTPSEAVAVPVAAPFHLAVFADQISLDPTPRARALRALGPFLEDALADGARVTIVSWNGSLRVYAAATTEPAAVKAALAELGAGAGGGVADAYDFAPEQRRALGALEAVVARLAGLEGRKAVLYVGGGIPFVPAGDLAELSIALSDDPRQRVSERFSADAAARFAELTRHANAAGVTLHTLDAAGVRAPRSVSPTTGRLNVTVANDSVRDQVLTGPLLMLAAETGGRAIVGTNALDQGLGELAADLANHYSLAVRPPAGFADGGDAAVEVRVDRPGARARHRQTVRARGTDERMAAAAISALHLPPDGNPLGAALALGEPEAGGRAGADTSLRRLAITVPLDRLVLLPDPEAPGELTGRIELWITALDAAGRRSPVRTAQATIRVPAATAERPTSYTVVTRIESSPGQAEVAVAVRDALGGDEAVVVAGPAPARASGAQ